MTPDMKITILKLNTPTATGRIYTEKSFNEIPKKVYGVLPSSGFRIEMDKVFGEVTDIKIEGDELVGELKILETTPCGKIVQDLLDDGIDISYHSRGVGFDNNDTPTTIKEYTLTGVSFQTKPKAE